MSTVGCWQVPQEDFGQWAALGVDLLVGIPTPARWHDPAAWMAAARDKGFGYIVHAVTADGPTPYDPDDKSLLAVALADEPEAAGDRTPGQLKADVAAIRARGWTGPVFVNFDGNCLRNNGIARYKAYLDAVTDGVCPPWVAVDFYACNFGFGDEIGQISHMLDDLRLLAPAGSVLFAFVETSDQGHASEKWAVGTPLGDQMRAPTLAEARQQAVEQIAMRGAYPVLFPQRVAPDFCFDATTDEIRAGLPKLIADAKAHLSALPTWRGASAVPTPTPALVTPTQPDAAVTPAPTLSDVLARCDRLERMLTEIGKTAMDGNALARKVLTALVGAKH